MDRMETIPKPLLDFETMDFQRETQGFITLPEGTQVEVSYESPSILRRSSKPKLFIPVALLVLDEDLTVLPESIDMLNWRMINFIPVTPEYLDLLVQRDRAKTADEMEEFCTCLRGLQRALGGEFLERYDLPKRFFGRRFSEIRVNPF
jgi:hypothetical protein